MFKRVAQTWVCGFFLALIAFLPPAAAQGFEDERELSFERRFDRIRVLEMKPGQVINDQLYVVLRREIEAAASEGELCLVIDIDSPGGDVASAENISDLIRSYREHESLRILAFIGPDREAISAGAWIALACRGLVIAPSGLIGDIQPLVQGIRGFERAPEKLVTKITEHVWTSARENGLGPDAYPALFVRSMVDKDISIYSVRNPMLDQERFMRASEYEALSERARDGLIVEEVTQADRAFTTSGREMLRWGFRVKTGGDRAEILDFIGTPNAEIEVRKLEVASGFSIFGSFRWTWLLLVLGFVLIFAEFQAPGLGLFGILGVSSLIAFFLVQFGMTGGAILPIALLLFGIFLILFEAVILPGLLVPGLLGLALVLYSTYIGIARPEGGSWWPWPDLDDPASRQGLLNWATVIIASVVAGFGSSLILGRFLHRIPWIGKVIIVPPATKATANAAVTPTSTTGVEVGQRGEAVTDLRPSGMARIDGKKIDVVGRGPFIERGQPVEICEVRGNRVVVKLAAEQGENGSPTA